MLPKFFSPLCPSWAPPDFVNPLLKNMPTLEPQGSLCTHPWGVLCYSPHGEESPRTYRIKRCLFRLEKRILSALQTSSAGHIWKNTQLLAENLFSAERINSLYPSQKGTSNSWFSGWGDGGTPSPARLQKLLQSLPILENSTIPLFPGNFILQQRNGLCWCFIAQGFICLPLGYFLCEKWRRLMSNKKHKVNKVIGWNCKPLHEYTYPSSTRTFLPFSSQSSNIYKWGCRLSTKTSSQAVVWLFSRHPRASNGINAIHWKYTLAKLGNDSSSNRS